MCQTLQTLSDSAKAFKDTSKNMRVPRSFFWPRLHINDLPDVCDNYSKICYLPMLLKFIHTSIMLRRL